LIIISFICVIWLKPDSSFKIGDSMPSINVPPLLDMIFGISLLVYASIRQFKVRQEDHKTAPVTEKAKRIITTPGSIFSFGLIRSSLSVTNLLAVVIISKTLVVNNAGPLAAALAITVAIIIGLIPLLAAPFLYKYNPRLLKSIQAFIDRFTAKNASRIITFLLAVTGLIFLIHGAAQVSGVSS
jgi:hypothetical protein